MGELGIAIISATAAAFLARLLKQPMILGYIIAGVMIGPAFFGLVTNSDTIKLMSELGIAFLLFLTGLEINLQRLKKTGGAAAILGVLQVSIVFALGYFAAGQLGFGGKEPIYIGIALAFSSTMIAVKLLADKGELDTLHGRIILGVLMVQDVIAIAALTLLPNLGNFSLKLLFPLLMKGLLLFSSAAIAAKFVVPTMFRAAARSQELLFLAAVSWCMSFAFFSGLLGYSLAIGAFLAGLAIASSAYNVEIIAKVRPLRDFFSTLFFVSLGMQLIFSGNASFAGMAASIMLFSAVVIIANPFIVSLILGVLGYTRRTAVLSGLSITHISEFSLIAVYLGSSLGHIGNELVTIVVAVAAITITVASYMVKYDEQIYKFLSRISIFNRLLARKAEEEESLRKAHYDVILCGHNRIGYSILKVLKEINNEIAKPFIVVDFNPDTIAELRSQKIPCLYGDVGDEEVLERLNTSQAEMIVSTVPSLQDNLLLLKKAKSHGRKPIVIATASHIDEALQLYDAKADYVILPHLLGGEHVGLLLETFTKNSASVIETRLRHMAELQYRKELGH